MPLTTQTGEMIRVLVRFGRGLLAMALEPAEKQSNRDEVRISTVFIIISPSQVSAG
jgi:hypothetical protein